mmetsp:Transcript_2081/g.3087  ORF Transcript_2081/g.3087 Transcript_2081/m.3087 type:complete len:153 (-) Transcript_2081:271-729(-)
MASFSSFTEPNMEMEDPHTKWKVVNSQTGCIRVGDQVRVENLAMSVNYPGVNRLFTGVGVSIYTWHPIPFSTFKPLVDRAIAPLQLAVAQSDKLTYQDEFKVVSPQALPRGACISSITPIILESNVHPEVQLHVSIQLTYADYDKLAKGDRF